MKLLIALAVLVAAASALRLSDEEVRPHWESFKATHGKTYSSPMEEAFRMKIFKDNMIKVQKHNERHAKGEVSFTVGINQFSDMHTHEVVERMNGLNAKAKTSMSSQVHKANDLGWPWSRTVDWRDHGYVTPVKNQGHCGSCWSFSTTGSLEGQLFKKNGKLVSLSEQHLIDCSLTNNGCGGGLMDDAFDFIKNNNGIETEASYPYTSSKGWFPRFDCIYNSWYKAPGAVTGYVDVNPTERDLADAVAKVGPVSVAIDASQWSFHHYKSGLYYEPKCGNTRSDLDHGVLAVGYGSDWLWDDYWIVKNSWGTTWGEEGYIKMARNRNNNCGIATMASYPTV